MNKKLVLIAGLAITFLIGVAVGATMVSVININYIIELFHEPTISEPLTFEPDPLNLDLGTITAVLQDSEKFYSAATLTVPESYEITATLDPSSISNFDYLVVKLWFNSREIEDYTATLLVAHSVFSASTSLYAGTYDVDVAVTYEAKNVTATGTIAVTLS